MADATAPPAAATEASVLLDPGDRAAGPVRHTLPVHLTSFVGRRAELAAVSALLGGRRLVTLTGVGGSGKTRLAAQLAADQAERWPDGVWWVELEGVTDPAQVAEVAAARIGVLVEPVQGSLRSLAVQLWDRRMLVCLDNCEQVLEGAAEVAEALLRSGAGVTVLTTSREPLGVAGETVWQVPPLSEDDALALFLERASLVRPGFTLDASSEAAATRDRHLAWFLAFAEALEPELQRDLAAWQTRVEREHDNLRAALDWAGGVRPGTRSPPGGRVAVAMASPPARPRGPRVPAAGHRAGAG